MLAEFNPIIHMQYLHFPASELQAKAKPADDDDDDDDEELPVTSPDSSYMLSRHCEFCFLVYMQDSE